LHATSSLRSHICLDKTPKKNFSAFQGLTITQFDESNGIQLSSSIRFRSVNLAVIIMWKL
jgi:hypothetical protein